MLSLELTCLFRLIFDKEGNIFQLYSQASLVLELIINERVDLSA